MSAFSLTKVAKQDFKAIARYTQKQWGSDQRKLYLIGLNEKFQQLATSPKIGVECGIVTVGLRKLPYKSHTIYYEQNNDGSILIVRVLHKSMDVGTQF